MAFSEALRFYGERKYVSALESARTEARRSRTQPRDPLYQRLLDEICMHSAATGSVIGFDGRLLQVLPANPDTAWLGVQQQPQRPSVCSPDSEVLEFGSIHDALEAAQDGDVVQLLPGTHVTSQSVLTISKRIMVTGAKGCSNAQVILDHRANHPAFCIDRSCILRGFTIDMVGFTEALSITGASTTVKPILQDLVVLCSGDDGIAVGGKAQPLIRSCEVRVRYCGLKQNEHASTTLWQSTIAGCKHALIAAGDSQTFFEGCKLEDCDQEAILGLQKARVNLTDCVISNCKGCAVDMSDESSVVLKQVDVVNCQGGIWLWHKTSCEAICSHITGGNTYAVLLDAEAYARGSSCTIDGPCHITNMPGEPEHNGDGVNSSQDNTSEGAASEDSLLSSASPTVYRQTGAAAAGKGGHQGGQQLSRQAFKAAAAAAAAARANHSHIAGNCLMSGLLAPGATASAELQSFGSASSPFGSSNGSAVGSAYEFEVHGTAAGVGGVGGGGGLAHYEELVQASMCVADKAAAAALFPPEVGGFVRPQVRQFGRY